MKDIWWEDQWHFDFLATPLPDQVRLFLNQQTLASWGVCDAAWAWKGQESGIYTAASGYKWLTNSVGELTPDFSWPWVWKLDVPEKLRFFIWLVLHGLCPQPHFATCVTWEGWILAIGAWKDQRI